jgi:hypothetical protein
MPYNQFQYIAYQIPTVTSSTEGVTIYGLPAGEVRNPPPLDGPTANLDADARSRVERLIGAMKEAENRIQAFRDRDRDRDRDNDDNILKIFVAPEFYFRPDVRLVSYSSVQYRAIKDVLRATIARDARFRHWLVVPGTIMWESNEDTGKRRNPERSEIYFNTAIYVYGGEGRSRVIEKVVASGIDGIPTGRHSGHPEAPGDPTKKSTDEVFNIKYQSAPKVEKHLFTVENVRFGLDICLDHGFWRDPLGDPLDDIRITRHAVILRRLLNFALPLDPIHIHLLTAGGMRIIPESVAAKTQGYILRNDGLLTTDPNGQTNCKQISRYDLPGAEFDLAATAVLGPDVPIDATIDINAGHDLYLPAPANAGPDWAHHPQQIKIYHTCQIP